jgi:hypothetical protein
MENPRIVEDLGLFMQQHELTPFASFRILPYEEGLLLLYDICIVHICLACYCLKMAALLYTLPSSKADLLANYFSSLTPCTCGEPLWQNQ